MAYNFSNFDAEKVEPMGNFLPLPEGKYPVIIMNTEMLLTKKADGEYLKIEFQVLDESSYAGRKVWARLNLDNPNPKAVEIAEKELSAILRAVKKPRIKGPMDIVGCKLILELGIASRGDNDLGNPVQEQKIRAYLEHSDNDPHAYEMPDPPFSEKDEDELPPF